MFLVHYLLILLELILEVHLIPLIVVYDIEQYLFVLKHRKLVLSKMFENQQQQLDQANIVPILYVVAKDK